MLGSSPGVRTVQCYLCHRHFDVPARAMSLSCPWCYRRVTLDDVVIKDSVFAKSLRTCGRIVVLKRGILTASMIEGRTGVEVFGKVEGPIRCGTRLLIASTGSVRGDVQAPSLFIEPGGRLDSPRTFIAPGAESLGADDAAIHAAGQASASGHAHHGSSPSHATGDGHAEPERRALAPAFDAQSARKAGEKLRVVLNLREGGWTTAPLPPNGMKRRR